MVRLRNASTMARKRKPPATTWLTFGTRAVGTLTFGG